MRGNTLKRSKAVRAALERKGGAAPKDYNAMFTKRYDSPREALADACEAMFNLNRYTRHKTCSDDNRHEILELKSAFVAFLYDAEEYTDRVEKLTKHLPEQECDECGGSGCDRCDETGMWREPRDVVSYVFRFTVDGRRFTWVQPGHTLNFQPRVEETRPDDRRRGELDTAMNIRRSKLAEAKALIRFALRAKARKGSRSPK